MRRFITRKDDAESSVQTKDLDPMASTERTVFFHKAPSENSLTIDDLDKEDFKSSGPEVSESTKSTPLETQAQNESDDESDS